MKQTFRRFFALALALLTAFPFFALSCGRESKQTATSLDFFDTVTTLTVRGPDADAFAALRDEVFAELTLCHKLFDIYNEYEGMTNLASVNRLAGGEPLRVDRRITELLSRSLSYGEQTDGAFSVTMGAVLRLWHEAREETKLPPDAEALGEAAKHCGDDLLELDENAGTVRLTDPLASLDVGAVAKGYAAARSLEILRAAGVKNALLNLGGTVCTVGGDFRIGLQDPRTPENYLRVVTLTDRCAVTSGDYERCFFCEGVRYHHIVDPATFFPSVHASSVTVLGDDPCLGDALSTALFCMEPEAALALVREHFPGQTLLIVSPDGELFTDDPEVFK